MSPALAQREIALAGVALLAAIVSLALTSHGDGSKTRGLIQPMTLNGSWRVSLAGAEPVQYGRRTNCSIARVLLGSVAIGVVYGWSCCPTEPFKSKPIVIGMRATAGSREGAPSGHPPSQLVGNRVTCLDRCPCFESGSRRWRGPSMEEVHLRRAGDKAIAQHLDGVLQLVPDRTGVPLSVTITSPSASTSCLT